MKQRIDGRASLLVKAIIVSALILLLLLAVGFLAN